MTDRYDNQLDQLWDALVTGQPAGDSRDDAEFLGALHTLHAANPPGSARERARQRVFEPTSRSKENTMTTLTLPASLPVTNGHSPGLRVAPSSPAARRMVSRRQLWLSLAAVLALLLAGLSGWFAYDRLGDNNSVPAFIPAVQEATPTADANDWPMYRGNPGRTGVMPGSGPKADVGAVWSIKVDGSAYRSPIVVGDTAYAGSTSGLYALDAETGQQRWQFTGDASLEITPAYLDGIVYIPSQAGTLYAIDAETGDELWHFAEPTAEFATPTFGDGLLFVGSETNNALYGIDPKTGEEVWHFDTGGAIRRGQAYADGVLYSGSEGGNASPATPEAGASPVAGAGFDQSQIQVLWSVSADDTNPLARPGGMAIAPDGNIYIADGLNDTILVYSPDGKLIEQWGETGTGHGQFQFHEGAENWLGSLGFDADGNLFVFDVFNRRVQKFAPDHTFLLEWGTTGTANGQFRENIVGAVDAKAGLVYVANWGNDRVQVFDLDGNFVDKWGSTGTKPGQFRGPFGISVDPAGNVYVAEENGHRLQKFDASGLFIDASAPTGQLGGPYSVPAFVTFDAAGNTYVSDWAQDKIEILDPDGAVIGTIDTVPGLGPLTEPTGVVFDADGNLILGQEQDQRVVKIALPPLPD